MTNEHPSLDPDIVIRLRSWGNSGLLAEAADEIERLRAALMEIVSVFEGKLEDADASQIMGETARRAFISD